MLTTNQNLQQGRYRIVSQHEQNGSGTAYEAFDTVQEASVLLKEIRDNLEKVTTPAQLEARNSSFSKKAKALTEMKHESLLSVKDFFSEVDHHYLVTEFSEGNTLGELLEKNKKPFSLAEISTWADNLLDALTYLHTLTPPVIHGEVKPQNIRLTADGKVKLLVFNLVKSDEEISAATANQTFDAAVLPYLALEQIWQGLDAASKKVILTNFDEKSEKILEQPADARSDVYALGATLYHLLTACAPADALTRSIDLLEGKADPLQSPTELNPSVPREVSEVLLKALEIKREERYSSASIMRQVLRSSLTRVKEREENRAHQPQIEDDAVLEIPVVKPAQPASAPKNTELESEQARQLELIKQQLREVEERRLEAERRAAEAEKRLLEAEAAHVSDAPFEQKSASALSENAAEEFPSFLNEEPQEGGAFKKIAAAAVALVVLGGGIFGVWTFTQSKAKEPMPSVTTNNAALPAPASENKPAESSTAPQQSEQTATQPGDTTTTENASPAFNPAAVKPKAVVATPTPQTAQVKKTTPTPAKQAEKKVTLDDLLKDN